MGGMDLFVDNKRISDHDNPMGYFEHEKVKDLAKESSWILKEEGKVIKVISYLLKKLPAEAEYNIIFMNRKIEEILKSQNEMLKRAGIPLGSVSDEVMGKKFNEHLENNNKWLKTQNNMHVHYVDYNQLIANPKPIISELNKFLGGIVNEKNSASAINTNLYRQKVE